MTDIVGYSAGILDGEGNIGWRYTKKDRDECYYPMVTITNTNEALLQFLYINWGGNIQWEKRRPEGHLGKKKVARWHLYGKKARYFLKMIYPHLIVKKWDAELALKFMDTVGKVGRTMPIEVIQQRIELRRQWKKMHHQNLAK